MSKKKHSNKKEKAKKGHENKYAKFSKAKTIAKNLGLIVDDKKQKDSGSSENKNYRAYSCYSSSLMIGDRFSERAYIPLGKIIIKFFNCQNFKTLFS